MIRDTIDVGRGCRAGFVLAILFMCAAATRLIAQNPAAPASPEDSVRAVEMARGQALMHADTVALSRMIADEFTEVSRLGTLRTKADNLRDISSGDLKLTSVRYDSLSVRLYGNVAVLQGIADNAGMFRSMPFTGKVRYTRVFVRRDGRWQAVTMQQTSMQ